MTNVLPIVIVGLASFLLLTQRDGRVVLGAFFLQWAGIGWLVWVSPSAGAGSLSALVEWVAALSTTTVIALTIFRTTVPDDQTYPAGVSNSPTRRSSSRGPAWQPQDWVLRGGLGVLAGVAGYGLARVNPLAVNENDLLAFFWVALTAVLMLTLDGARSAIKLGLGLLSLLNAAFLLLYATGSSTPEVGVLALGALTRIGAGMLASYLWLAIGERYGTLNLNALFDKREGIAPQASNLALAIYDTAPVDSRNEQAVIAEEQGDEEETGE